MHLLARYRHCPYRSLFSAAFSCILCATVGRNVRMAQLLQAEGKPRQDPQKLPTAAVLTALGVVYGDIGTSTLYGLKQAVDAGGTPTPETVIGTVSLIFWALLLIVGLKYAILILRADNHGEDGIVALHDALGCKARTARNRARIP